MSSDSQSDQDIIPAPRPHPNMVSSGDRKTKQNGDSCKATNGSQQCRVLKLFATRVNLTYHPCFHLNIENKMHLNAARFKCCQ